MDYDYHFSYLVPPEDLKIPIPSKVANLSRKILLTNKIFWKVYKKVSNFVKLLGLTKIFSWNVSWYFLDKKWKPGWETPTNISREPPGQVESQRERNQPQSHNNEAGKLFLLIDKKNLKMSECLFDQNILRVNERSVIENVKKIQFVGNDVSNNFQYVIKMSGFS